MTEYSNLTRAVVGTHFAIWVSAHQPCGYPGIRLLDVACSLNGYPGSIFITRVGLLPTGTGYPFTALPFSYHGPGAAGIPVTGRPSIYLVFVGYL